MNPIKSIEAFFKRIPKGKVLVALSGGADSVCLLLALKELEINVCAFHLNHSIRGEEADRDQMFCQNLCEKKNIPFSASKADVPAYAVDNSLGLEEAARKLRYQALEEEAIRVCADYIATAHNADDNAETVIFPCVPLSNLRGGYKSARPSYKQTARILQTGRNRAELQSTQSWDRSKIQALQRESG